MVIPFSTALLFTQNYFMHDKHAISLSIIAGLYSIRALYERYRYASKTYSIKHFYTNFNKLLPVRLAIYWLAKHEHRH